MDRLQWRPPIDEVAFGAFRLVPHERALYRHGMPVRLAGRAFDLLVADESDKLLDQDALIQEAIRQGVALEAIPGPSAFLRGAACAIGRGVAGAERGEDHEEAWPLTAPDAGAPAPGSD